MGRYETKIGSKVLAITITTAMLMSGVILSGGKVGASNFDNELDSILESIDPEFIGTGQDVSLVDIRAPPYYRPAFTGKDNQLELQIKNDDNLFAVIKVDLYHVEPDKVTESFLKTTRPIVIFGNQEKTFNAFRESEDMWKPTEIGRNWIRGEIYAYILGQGWALASEFRESFWVIPGARPILELQNTVIIEDTVWENMTVIVDGDITVAEGAKLSTSNSDVFADDLDVSGETDIPAGDTWNMNCSSDGQFAVRVYSNGTLNIWGNLTNDPDDHCYWFYMNGTLNIERESPPDPPGLVEFAYGDTSNLSNPGGIICTTPNVYVGEGAVIREGATHGIYFMNNSGGVVKDSYITDNGGHGIVCVEGSSPTIENNEITWNEGNGIYAEDSAPAIRNNGLIQYNRIHGVYLENVTAASAKVEGNIIQDNFASGIYAIGSNATIANNTISSNGLGLKFRDTMENGVENWTATGMWHRVDNESGDGNPWNLSHSRDWSWWYGNDTTGDYDDGERNWGNLTSETINLQNATTASLVFWYWYETDGFLDERLIVVNDSVKEIRRQLFEDDMSHWNRYALNISEFAGSEEVTISFFFDTIDDSENIYRGWYIDDVEVISAYPAIEGHGIYLNGTVNSSIYNNTITSNNWCGIYGYDVALTDIDGNSVSGNREQGVEIEESSDVIFSNNWLNSNVYGLRLYKSNDNTIINNNASNNYVGLLTIFSGDNGIINNSVSYNSNGISICGDNTDNNTVMGNTVFSNIYFGIAIQTYCRYNTVSHNIVSDNLYGFYYDHGGGGWENNTYADNSVVDNIYGFYIMESQNNTIVNNTISSNDYGICLLEETVYFTTITMNILLNNSYYGIYVGESSNYNAIYYNSFIDNINQAFDNGTGTYWDNGYPYGGNYWDDYNGTDEYSGQNQDILYSDGVGDSNYSYQTGQGIGGDLSVDRYPLMSPFVSSATGLWVERNETTEDIVLHWSNDTGIPSHWMIYGSEIKMNVTDDANLLATIPGSNFTWVHEDAYGDAEDWYYIVRGFDGLNQSRNSTIGVKADLSFTYNTAKTNINWFSLPYSNIYYKASDIVMELEGALAGPGLNSKISVIGKWIPGDQGVTGYYYDDAFEEWTGDDFTLNFDDGLFFSITSNWTWVINGTDAHEKISFTYNTGKGNMNWLALPYTCIYNQASDIVLELEGALTGSGLDTKISAVGKWMPGDQAATSFAYDDEFEEWFGDDFIINPGDGIYLYITSSFNWSIGIISPEIP